MLLSKATRNTRFLAIAKCSLPYTASLARFARPYLLVSTTPVAPLPSPSQATMATATPSPTTRLASRICFIMPNIPSALP